MMSGPSKSSKTMLMTLRTCWDVHYHYHWQTQLSLWLATITVVRVGLVTVQVIDITSVPVIGMISAMFVVDLTLTRSWRA